MIDANSQFFAILTKVGKAKQANADALGIPWKITEMGVGDANDTDPIPNEAQTRLINEWRRRPLNQLRVDPANSAVIIAEQVIPADEGGRWIREIGLYDADGDLVAVANCAPSFKPMLSQGSGRTQIVRMNFIVSSTGNITLKIDPAVVLATREYVDQRILEELYKLDSKQSVRVATGGNIALAGLQTIDGIALVAGDRVLVKNQTVAKDNGLYIAAAGVWARALDADTSAEVTSALLVSVEQGATLADTRWQLVTDGVIVLGTTALTFQNVTQGFAPINSPAFQGLPTAPAAPRFDSSKLLATTEWARRQGKQYSGSTAINNNGSILAEAVGQAIVLFGDVASTINLPVSSDFPNPGVVVTLICYNTTSSAVTRAGTDLIYGANPGQSVSVQNIKMVYGDILELTLLNNAPGAGAWYVSGGNMFASVVVPQFDSGQRVASTRFVQKALGNYSSGRDEAGNGLTLPLSDIGGFVSLTAGGAQTVALPLLESVPDGATVTLHNPTGQKKVVTINGGNRISPDGQIYTVVTLGPGDVASFTKQSGVWRMHGSAALKYSAQFSASMALPGYSKLPSGFVEQWGQGTTSTSGDVEIVFPIAWSIMPLGIHVTPVLGQDVARPTIMMTTYKPATGTTRFAVGGFLNGSRIGETFFWRAIGEI